jgi:23S rRNA G2445 N2-methylase RlmL
LVLAVTSHQLELSPDFEKLTHYIFRFPAKFHPPVVKALLDRYTVDGDLVLDPFCGSGTLLVEAAVAGRSAIGADVDPVATMTSFVKTRSLDEARLRSLLLEIEQAYSSFVRSDNEYFIRRYVDITSREYDAALAHGLRPPAIPNLLHWFRKYVIIDLARIKAALDAAILTHEERQFFLVCFASIIRASSNADPVPVSGLEVTSHMKKIDARGRVVNPFALFSKATRRSIAATNDYACSAKSTSFVEVVNGDITNPTTPLPDTVDAVITSPPYHSAVDYYRRHQLEMYWLGLTKSQDERLALRRRYIGQDRIAKSDPRLGRDSLLPGAAAQIEAEMRAVSPDRADAFRHYAVSMSEVLQRLSKVVTQGKPLVFVVGHSTWNGTELSTSRLFEELAPECVVLDEVLWYPVRNRYMSYKRHNGASIDKEYVLVFRKTL